MQIYTIKEASRKTKIGIETLKRALEEGLIKGTQLANRQWRIAESALDTTVAHLQEQQEARLPSSPSQQASDYAK